MKRRKVEILAPAGSLNHLKSAVYNGADAIYCGGEKFSARKSAQNFSHEDLVQGRKITKKNGVKLYVALNTIIFEDELEAAVNYALELEKIGIDALIIQDLGLMSLIKKHLPEMEIHSSTQMSIHNYYGANFLKELGVKRVVVPRESTSLDIIDIKKTGVEVEAFVHGALCISYSGQCLFSSLVGGRSGNRGACAQPCRMKYTLVDKEKNKLTKMAHLLSPKDLMLLDNIEALLDSGVDSLKIEGRMKTPEYVGLVVAAYRKAIDKWQAGQEIFIDETTKKELAQVFSRDFTEGYFKGISGADLMNVQKPNHRGVLVGRVVSYDQGKTTIKLKDDLEIDDRLSIWTKKDGRVNTSVNKIILNGERVQKASKGSTVILDLPTSVRSEDRVFKLESSKIKRDLEELLDRHEDDTIEGLDVIVKGEKGGYLQMTFKAEDGREVNSWSTEVLEEALKYPLTEETLRGQMRFGGTEYFLKSLDFQVEDLVMVPKSVLNNMRRNCLKALEVEESPVKKVLVKKPKLLEKPEETVLIVLVDTIGKLREALKEEVAYICYPLISFQGKEENGVKNFLSSLDSSVGSRIVIDLPRIIRAKELPLVLEQISELKNLVGGFRAQTLDGLALLKSLGVGKIFSGSGLNIVNSWSYSFLQKEFEPVRIELSSELTLRDIEKLGTGGLLQVYGAKEVMILEHCLIGSNIKGKNPCRQDEYSLEDRLGIMFPLRTDKLGRTHIFNSKVLFLSKEIKELYNSHHRSYLLDMTLTNEDELRNYLKLYLKLLRGLELKNENVVKEITLQLQELVRDYTKGHYHRGVRQ